MQYGYDAIKIELKKNTPDNRKANVVSILARKCFKNVQRVERRAEISNTLKEQNKPNLVFFRRGRNLG